MFCKSAGDSTPRTSRIDLLTFKNGSLEFPDQSALEFMQATAAQARLQAIEFYVTTTKKLDSLQG